MSSPTLPDIYLSFFMFTTDMKPTDPDYRKLVVAHLRALTAQGYTGFEFPIKPTFSHEFEQDVTDYLDLRKFLDAEGFANIKFATNVGATRTYDPSSPFPAQRREALRYLKSRVDITAALGGEIMMGPIIIPYGGFLTDDFNTPIWGDQLQDDLVARYKAAQPILEELGQYAETQCVKLAIEPITHWETPGPNKLSQLLDFLGGIESKAVGAVIDSAHETLDGDGAEMFRKYVAELARQERLHYVQVSPPDRGALHTSWMPWDGFLPPVLEHYKGPIAIEIFNGIPVFDAGLRLSRRKFWVPGEDIPNDYPSAYETAQAAIEVTQKHLARYKSGSQPSGPSTVSGPAPEPPVTTNTPGTYYQYNPLAASVNKVFDGNLTVGELKTRGDLGLGDFSQLDGEVIMLDGIVYRADDKGKVNIPQDDQKIVYANATQFVATQSFAINAAANFKSLRDQINAQLPSPNLFYAFRIHGHFKRMQVGTLIKQEKPYTVGTDVLVPNRPTFEREDFSGTIVGFYCPDFMGDLNIQGYHMHFVSDDKTFAGHVMELDGDGFDVAVDHLYHYTFDVPSSREYLEGDFNRRFQYNHN